MIGRQCNKSEKHEHPHQHVAFITVLAEADDDVTAEELFFSKLEEAHERLLRSLHDDPVRDLQVEVLSPQNGIPVYILMLRRFEVELKG